MATQPEQVVLTYEDLQDLPEDRNRYELFGGELEVTPSPNKRHQLAVTSLSSILFHHTRQGGLGQVFVAPFDVVLDPSTVLQPDILFVATARLEIVRDHFVAGPPDLVVEVLSPTTAHRDRQAKLQLYARYSVPNYWLVDADEEAGEAHVLGDGRYRLVLHSRGLEVVTAPPFPNLVIRLADIFNP